MNSLAGTNSAAGGNTPNWAAGYVPSASEWNAWWGAKLDTIGGTLNGSLIADTLTANTVNGTTVGATTMITKTLELQNGWTLLNDASNNDLCEHSSGNYDVWLRSNGSRAWVANGTAVMTLDATGNLTVPGTMFTKGINFSSGFALGQDASNNDLIEHSSGNYEVWNRNDGGRDWVANGVAVMALDASGNLNIKGSFTPNGNVTVSGTITGLGAITSVGPVSCGGGLSIATQQVSDFDMFRAAPYRTLQWGTGANIAWSEADGSVIWNTPTLQAMKLDASGNLTVPGTVHGSNITTLQETIDELNALVQDLQTRLETMEAQAKS